jgi:hypothetical protein
MPFVLSVMASCQDACSAALPITGRKHTGEAINTLVGIMRNKRAPPAARAMASNAILDRGYGKPAQTMNANVKTASLQTLSDEELTAIAIADDHTTH